jgi:hypothetical protein
MKCPWQHFITLDKIIFIYEAIRCRSLNFRHYITSIICNDNEFDVDKDQEGHDRDLIQDILVIGCAGSGNKETNHLHNFGKAVDHTKGLRALVFAMKANTVMPVRTELYNKESKAIPPTGRGGLYGCDT